MAAIQFEVHTSFDAPSRELWDELVDWKAHEHWIPATRVEMSEGDPLQPGYEFVAFTGIGPLALEDRMRVAEVDWDEATASGRCEVTKLGPVLEGRAGFTVRPTPDGSEMVWFEDVAISWLPSFLAPVVSRMGAAGFKLGMRSLAKTLSKRSPAS